LKTRSLYLTWSPNGTGLWQTDGQTELPYIAITRYASSRA